MKDIDFDELDKAVTALMGGVKNTPEQPAAKTLSINTTLKDGEEPEYNKIKRAAEKIGSETILDPAENTEVIAGVQKGEVNTVILPESDEKPASEMPLPDVAATPKPANGRFMDVMHPSSDMKTATATSVETPAQATEAESPSRLSREGATIQSPTPPAPAPRPTPVPVAVTRETVSAFTPPPSPKTERKVESVPVASVPSTEPLTSPFIPDAKVEKRPLGGAAQDTSDDLSSFDRPYDTDRSIDTQLAPNQEVGELEMPAELSSDLLAIETNAAESEAEFTVPVSNRSRTTQPASNDIPAATEAPAREESATEAPVDGAIYDTSEYHKPIEHSAKHGREWLWIAIIVVVVVVCAAGAVAIYLLGTQ